MSDYLGYSSSTPRTAGFTVIEIAFVMIVAAIILLTVLSAYEQYISQKRLQHTKDSLTESTSQITFFFANALRYPCPADRSLPESDPLYGTEFDPVDCIAAANALGPPPVCTPGGGICVVEGSRDADGDTINDPVIIGGLPIAALREINDTAIESAAVKDGWGARLSYAVTLRLTSDDPVTGYRFDYGVIEALDENGQPTAGVDQDAHYTIVSHGPDRVGAFLDSGQIYQPCADETVALDNENCDQDGTFIQALGAYSGAGVEHHDDHIYFTKNQSSVLWAYIPMTTHIQNMNVRNVGVNTSTPDKQLDVVGNLRTDNNVLVETVCLKSNEGKCFDIENITGDSMENHINCPAGEVMVGISQGQADCEVPVFQGIEPNFTCPVDQFINGFRATGEPICILP